MARGRRQHSCEKQLKKFPHSSHRKQAINYITAFFPPSHPSPFGGDPLEKKESETRVGNEERKV